MDSWILVLEGPVEVSKVVWEEKEAGIKQTGDDMRGHRDQEGLTQSQSCRQTHVVGTQVRSGGIVMRDGSGQADTV